MEEKYFEANDMTFFDIARYGTYRSRRHNKNMLTQFEQKILDKYPSEFFNSWLKNIGITNVITADIISKIKMGDIKWQFLLSDLAEQKYYKGKKFYFLAKSLINNGLINLLLLLLIPRQDKNFIINMVSDKKLLLKLKLAGYNAIEINKKILINNNDYKEVEQIIASSDEDARLELTSLCNMNVIKKLYTNKFLNLNTDKNLQKMLTNACINKNYDLISYLLNKNIFPSQNDLLHIFCITKKVIEPKKRRYKKKVITKQRYYRKRYLHSTDKFNKKYTINIMHYTIAHEDYLVKLIDILVKNNIKHPFENNINVVIMKFLSINRYYIAIHLMLNYQCTLKLKEYLKRGIIYNVILLDDVQLFKNIIKIGIIKTESFNTKKKYLSYALRHSSYKIANYMVNTLKMKITTSIFERRQNYYFRASSQGKENAFNYDYEKLINFFIDNNLTIDKKLITIFISYGNFEALKYCEKKINMVPTLKNIIQLLPKGCNGTSKKNYIKIFKYFYDKTDQKRSVLSLVLSLLKKIDKKNGSLILSMIKHITKHKKIKTENIMIHAFRSGHLKIIKYFNDVHKIPMSNSPEIVSSIRKFITKDVYDQYRFHGNFENLENLFNLYEYLKLASPTLFDELEKILHDENSQYKNDSIYALAQYRMSESVVFKIYNYIYKMFNHKINSDDIFRIFNTMYYIPVWYSIIFKIVEPDDKLASHILYRSLEYSYDEFMRAVTAHEKIKNNITLKVFNSALYAGSVINMLMYMITNVNIVPTPYSYSVLIRRTLIADNPQNIFWRRYRNSENNNFVAILNLLNSYQKKITNDDHKWILDYMNENKLLGFDKLKFNIIEKYDPLDSELVKDEIFNRHNLRRMNLHMLDDLDAENLNAIDDFSDNDSDF